MLAPRTVMLQARSLVPAVQSASSVLRLSNRGPPLVSTVTVPKRDFSVSSYLLHSNAQHYANISSNDFPSFTWAKTTRTDIGVKPGTDFSFHRVPLCLVPRYWSNDPRKLELSLGLDLHQEYSSFPQTFSPVLSYMGEAAWSAWLICEGSGFDPDFYLVMSDDQVFRLDTSIELLPLLVIMKEQTKDAIGKDGEMPFGLKWLMEHPDLEWHQLDQDEWMERCTQATS